MIPIRPRIKDIIRAARECSGVPPEAMSQKRGKMAHVEARWCAAWVARSVGYYVKNAADALNHHHAPIMRGITRIDGAICAGDKAIVADLETIEMRARELTRRFRSGLRGRVGAKEIWRAE